MKYFILICACSLAVGCSSVINSHRQKSGMMDSYLRGDNASVQAVINKKLDSSSMTSVVGKGDEIMWRLEAGSMHFQMGNFQNSLSNLETAEKLIHEYDDRATVSVRDVGSETAAMATNLNALPYRGLCRDRMALSIFKSMAYLGLDKEESFRAQLHRLRDEQVKVQEDYRKFFEKEQEEVEKSKQDNPEAAAKLQNVSANGDLQTQNATFNQELTQVTQVANRGYGNFLNPAALFLSALGSMRDGNYDNARIDFKRIYEAMPSNTMAQRYYVTALQMSERDIPVNLTNVKPFDFPLDHDCVYVIFANGRSAAFKQIAIYFPIMTAWPICEFYNAPFAKMVVEADGQSNDTMLLADMDAILAQEYKERLPGMITRITLNTLIKEAAFHVAAHKSRDNFAVWLAVVLAGSAYRATMNTADTRSWEILPKEFQLTQLPMPKDRTLKLNMMGNVCMQQTVRLPDNCRSAIVYVGAPSMQNIACHVFPIKSK